MRFTKVQPILKAFGEYMDSLIRESYSFPFGYSDRQDNVVNNETAAYNSLTMAIKCYFIHGFFFMNLVPNLEKS